MLAVRSAATREVIRSALASAGVTVAGETEDVDGALALHQFHRPDLLVVDVGFPHVTGFVAALEVLTLDPSATVVASGGVAQRGQARAGPRARVAPVWRAPRHPAVVTRFARARLGGVGRAA